MPQTSRDTIILDEEQAPDAVAIVRAVLSAPDEQLDFARAKLTLDRIVDPSIDEAATLAELDRMTEIARRMAGPDADRAARIAAVRTLIYRAGPWNGDRAFDYDYPNFKDVRVKLIAHYLATRLGNCVSMPILFLILADRLGVEIGLAAAPSHVFVRHRDDAGNWVNLETTSGALPARDVWMIESRSVNDRAIRSGCYMRTLDRRESVAEMALTVVEHLNASGRFEESIAVCKIIISHNPRDGMAWANLGGAHALLIGRNFTDRYGSAFLIPLPLRARYLTLLQRNHAAYAQAKALGWEPVA